MQSITGADSVEIALANPYLQKSMLYAEVKDRKFVNLYNGLNGFAGMLTTNSTIHIRLCC